MIGREINKVTKKILKMDKSDADYVNQLEYYFKLNTSKMNFYSDVNIDDIIEYLPKYTVEKAQLYMKRIVVDNDTILGECEHLLADERVQSCIITYNTLYVNEKELYIKPIKKNKTVFFDTVTQQLINRKSSVYRKFNKYASVINNLT